MSNKSEYQKFLTKTYVPIYSQPWWLDAICGAENWDVWLYKRGEDILAAMPYYFENRGNYKYITKAPLTQNNGIIFRYEPNAKIQKRAHFEEKVINDLAVWLKETGYDVYEQQYMHTFNNWQPFFWNGFKCVLRYSYLIDNTVDLDEVISNYSSNLRKNIKKGQKRCKEFVELDAKSFYLEHEKIYSKQNLKCPFSFELWERLYNVCKRYQCGQALAIVNPDDRISSLAFFAWDDKYVYFLMGGSIPELSEDNTFSLMMHHGIEMASAMKKAFDFEGSMIKRVAKAMREYGGIPMPYYRIRKIFNPDIIRMEAEQEIKRLSE